MKYTIVMSKKATNNKTEIIYEVNELIKKGWKPQGGINVFYTAVGWIFHQAMIKEED